MLFPQRRKNDGSIYPGFDTRVLSAPAFVTTMEVLAANNVEVMIADKYEYTPTPVISHAILKYNHERKTGLDDGGFKYNPPNGKRASSAVTNKIEAKAKQLLQNNLQSVKSISLKGH